MDEEKSLDAILMAEIAIEALKGEKTLEEIANQYGISKSQVRKCKRQMHEKLPGLFSNGASPEEESENMEKKSGVQGTGSNRRNGLKHISKKIVYSLKSNHILWTSVSTVILAVFTGILAIYTVRMAHYTEKMSHHSSDTARYTRDMARYTNDMASSTEELVLVAKNPVLHIYCVIKSDLKYTTTDDGIQFKSTDYLDKRKKAKFYMAVLNKWRSNIKAKMKIKIGISVLGKDKFTLQSKIYNIDDFPIALGPSDISEVTEVKEIQYKLLGNDFNWRSSHFDKIVKIKIYKHLVEVPHYPYAGIDVTYFGFDEFKTLYNQFKKNKSKEI